MIKHTHKFHEVNILHWLRVIAMCWYYISKQSLKISPFFVIALDTAYHIFKFIKGGEWLQSFNWEDGVEPFLKGLQLNLNWLMELIVHN